MERQVRHLSRLVDDLLDVSRVTLGTLGLRKERVSLATVVQEAVEISRPLIEARRQGLTVSPPRQPVRWEADPVRLVQILTNLLHNAAQYTEEGGHIWLLAEREGNEVVLRVRDTGMGIPGEMLPRIFEPFQKPCPLPGRSQGGLGIGLSLVRRLVDLHGGVVEAASPGRGQGSEFVVRLPALPEQQAEAVPKAIRVSEAMPSSPKCRILVVDDDKDVAKMLATFLRLEGHEVRVAHSGHKAMEVAQEEPPDVILLDLGMPGMDGYEVAQRLRALPALKDVLLVALTGYGQEADRRRSEQAGFHGHLVKPVEPGALKQLLAHGDRGRVLGPSERAEVG
jgi:CheY-like chemotaxis protein